MSDNQAIDRQTLLRYIVLGFLAGVIIGAVVGGIVWLGDGASPEEVRAAVITDTMPPAQQAQMEQMLRVGAIIDFIVRVSLISLPFAAAGALVGGLLGRRRGRLTTPPSPTPPP